MLIINILGPFSIKIEPMDNLLLNQEINPTFPKDSKLAALKIETKNLP